MKALADGQNSQSSVSNPLAWICLVLSLATLPLFILSIKEWMPFFLITGVPSIVCGHLASSKIRGSFQNVRGQEVTQCGLWIAYCLTVAFPIVSHQIIPLFFREKGIGNTAHAINNCRQIILSLKNYAEDHNGKYPDAAMSEARSSNEVFHQLFSARIITEEKIFGCPYSPYQPDGYTGVMPNYLEALQPNENHWAMTKGLDNSSSMMTPLVFENPSNETWPPTWNALPYASVEPGRSWTGGYVVIGMNDGSVSSYGLTASVGKNVSLKPRREGTQIFSTTPKREILNVAKRPLDIDTH